jgi:predicted nucleic acid-binding protein
MFLPRKVFVDTSFLIVLLNYNESDHTKALTLYQQIKAEKVRKMTSEYVLLELGNGLSRLGVRRLAVDFFNQVYQNNRFEIVPATTHYSLRYWPCSKPVRIRNGDWSMARHSFSCERTKLTPRYLPTTISNKRDFARCY